MTSMATGYPVTFEVAYPEGGHRLMILVRWLLAVPHYIVLYFLDILANVVLLIAFFAILFTRRYPRSLFDFVVGIQRWTNNVMAYVLFHDRYPPFSFASGAYPPMQFEVRRREQFNRWLPLVKWLLAIPHYIVVAVLGLLAVLAYLGVWLAVLFTGRYPRGLFDFIVGVGRWSARVTAYASLLVDEYPPFSLR